MVDSKGVKTIDSTHAATWPARFVGSAGTKKRALLKPGHTYNSIASLSSQRCKGRIALNLKRLEHLIAVVEAGSLAAGARRVHLSQPALTRSIQALEAQAGLPLCERGPRGVKL